uniref:Uncharacterized protein n=1 Tax=Physcomitrium patens TaxID=3218 RepID=A0A2K1KMX5_PHYPA|nr:hypothetical protein PHYPA_006009 [Physcomitrium patens]
MLRILDRFVSTLFFLIEVLRCSLTSLVLWLCGWSNFGAVYCSRLLLLVSKEAWTATKFFSAYVIFTIQCCCGGATVKIKRWNANN